ncbi:hypothetical protein ACET7Q_11940 [Aeromonas veronii]
MKYQWGLGFKKGAVAGVLLGVGVIATPAFAVTSTPTGTIMGRAPIAENLEFEPASVYGVESKDVKLKYQFNDPDGDDELGSMFSWTTTDSTGNAITLGSAVSIPRVPEAAINQSLTACVTPKTNDIITVPSVGNQECVTTTVLPPAPLVKNVNMKIKEANGLFVDTNNLTATYTWEGVGNDTSIYAYGPLGGSATLLENGSGANTSVGTVPDFSLVGYAGRKLELSIRPQSHYGGIGSVVTTPLDAYIYNDSLPPTAEFVPGPGVYNSTNKTFSPPRYIFDRAGGAPGDRSLYKFYIGGTLVNQGETINGSIPLQPVPTGVYGFFELELTPRNGKLVSGAGVTVSQQPGLIDPNSKPVATDVKISTSTSFAVGATLTGTYTDVHDGYRLPGHSMIAWREYRNDTQTEKLSYLNSQGVVAYSDHTVNVNLPPFVVPSSLHGKKVELLVRACSLNSTCADNVQSAVSPIIGGVAPVVTSPGAKPSIDAKSVSFQPASNVYTPFYILGLHYVFNPNGGDFFDRSSYRFIRTNILTGEKTTTGWRETNNGLLELPCHYQERMVVELTPKNGLGIEGNVISVSTSDLGLGPSRLGYCYDMNRLPVASARPVVTFLSASSALYPGDLVGATYNTTYQTLPGMGVWMQYSWNNEPYRDVVTPGLIPSYLIGGKDIGKPVMLSLKMREADSSRAYQNRPADYSYTTGDFLSGIVIER